LGILNLLCHKNSLGGGRLRDGIAAADVALLDPASSTTNIDSKAPL
jgi:hypothetical protein